MPDCHGQSDEAQQNHVLGKKYSSRSDYSHQTASTNPAVTEEHKALKQKRNIHIRDALAG